MRLKKQSPGVYQQSFYLLSDKLVQKSLLCIKYTFNSNMTFFFCFVNKRASYPFGIISFSTCAGECDWLFHWQHKLCATFSASVKINYRHPIKVYYRICTLRHIRIEINRSQNVFWVLTWVGGYVSKFYHKILISANPC
jgi:hypothetical protein